MPTPSCSPRRQGPAVVTTIQGKGVFPEDHPLYGSPRRLQRHRPCGNALRNADVVFAVGTRFADEAPSSHLQGISFSIPPTRLIHADIDPGEIGKNYPVPPSAWWATPRRCSSIPLAALRSRRQLAGQDQRLRRLRCRAHRATPGCCQVARSSTL